jgi:hypothetical protein
MMPYHLPTSDTERLALGTLDYGAIGDVEGDQTPRRSLGDRFMAASLEARKSGVSLPCVKTRLGAQAFG